MQKQYRGSNFLETSGKEIKLDYYLIEEEKIFFKDDKPRCTYGIEIIENEIESELVNDISLDKNITIDMIEKLKANEVFPVHLRDVIEDLL